MKGLISLVAVAGAFFVVLMGGGSAVGLWKELEPPETSAAANRAVNAVSGKAGAGKATAKERRAKAKARAQAKAKARARNARNAEKARWAHAANRICLRAQAELVPENAPDSIDEAEAMLDRTAEVNARYNALLSELPPPPGHRAKIERLERLFAKEEALIEQVRDAVRDRDVSGMQELSDRLMVVGERQSDIMWKLGAYDCAL